MLMNNNSSFVESFRSINGSYLKLIDSLSALRALSMISSTFSNDGELLDRALGVLVENQDLERCSIYLRDGDQLVNAAGMDWDDLIALEHGKPLGKQSGATFALGEGVVGLTAQSGQLQHCHDCQSDARFLPRQGGDGPSAQKKVVGSVICVPISSGENILGVLNVSHPHANFFDEGHERSLMIFSNVLGQLLMNNRLIHQMDKQVRERTQQLLQALQDAEELRQRYETLSSIDDLTQLHNRRFFFPESRTALARALRYEQPFSVVLIDVDHFKVINDSFGHATGDIVLRRMAALMREQLREGDILARFGGEEFILALPETTADRAMILAERIREVVKGECWENDASALKVTVSIGISEVTGFTENNSHKLLEQLIMEADRALYYGKYHGRDQCRDYATLTHKSIQPTA